MSIDSEIPYSADTTDAEVIEILELDKTDDAVDRGLCSEIVNHKHSLKVCCLSVCGVFLLAIIISISVFVYWGLTPLGRPINDVVQAALTSGDNVTVVDEGDYFTFTHTEANDNKVGFIFYPGGHVDYHCYAPLLRGIAEQGYFVALLSVPLSLAILDMNKADLVLNKHGDDYEKWFVGGHSLGGAISCIYASSNVDKYVGLILFDGYSTKDYDLSATDLQILSVQSGIKTEEGQKTYDTAAAYFPDVTTTFHVIKGANHAQFGDYGLQPGDTTATISRDDQQRQAVNATATFLLPFAGN